MKAAATLLQKGMEGVVDRSVTVQLFARFRDLFERDAIVVRLGDGATVRDLRREIALLNPGVAPLLARSQIAINDELATDEIVVDSNDEIAILPPVSGG